MAEETDTQILLHAKDAADQSNAPLIIIRSSDTDVMVLAIHFRHSQKSLFNEKAKNNRWKLVDIVAICRRQGDEIYKALPGLHVLSGCDSTSGFNGKGKKTFFHEMKTQESVCNTLKMLGDEVPASPQLLAACEK